MKEIYGNRVDLAKNFFTHETENPYCLRKAEKGLRGKLGGKSNSKQRPQNLLDRMQAAKESSLETNEIPVLLSKDN